MPLYPNPGSGGGGTPTPAPGALNVRGAWRGDTTSPSTAYDTFPTTPGQEVTGWTVRSGGTLNPRTADVSGARQAGFPYSPPSGPGGGGALRSAPQGDNSGVEYGRTFTCPVAGNVVFDVVYGSESGFDKANVRIDNLNPVVSGVSGAGNWTHYEVPVSAGTHTLIFDYSKDSSSASFMDGIALANFGVPGVSTPVLGPTYSAGDLVYHGGSLWKAVATSRNVAPSKAAPGSWELVFEPAGGAAVYQPITFDGTTVYNSYPTATGANDFGPVGAARLSDGTVLWRGSISSFFNGTTLGNRPQVANAGAVPASCRPRFPVEFVVSTVGPPQVLRINPDGSMTLRGIGTEPGGYHIELDGITYQGAAL